MRRKKQWRSTHSQRPGKVALVHARRSRLHTCQQRCGLASAIWSDTNDNLQGTGSKEHLVETENNFWDDSTAGRRSDGHILHSEVGSVADESIGRPRVRQTVAKEHPLKCCDRCYQQTLKKKCQTGPSPRQTAVQQTDSRNDQPDDEATEDEIPARERMISRGRPNKIFESRTCSGTRSPRIVRSHLPLVYYRPWVRKNCMLVARGPP